MAKKMPKKLKPVKPKKHKLSEAELANDPSLRWCGYRRMELVWSDTHKTEMRFVEYTPCGGVRLANFVLGVVDGVFDVLSIRRPTAGAAGSQYYDVSKPAR